MARYQSNLHFTKFYIKNVKFGDLDTILHRVNTNIIQSKKTPKIEYLRKIYNLSN